MAVRGDVFSNPITGECAVVGEHARPAIEERFTVLRGTVGFRIGGAQRTAPVGEELVVPPGTPHDWWNAGTEEALVRVEVRSPAHRAIAAATRGT